MPVQISLDSVKPDSISFHVIFLWYTEQQVGHEAGMIL